MQTRRNSLRFLARSALMAAILAILSPWSLPLGALPVTLAVFALFLVASLTPPQVALTATAIYLSLGALGLPVFSGFCGGAGVFVGLTGGFLWGYLPAAGLVSLFAGRKKSRTLFHLLGMLLGLTVIYAPGCLWFALASEASFSEALSAAVLPFLLPDLVKIVAATALAVPLKRRLGGFFESD